MYSIGIVGNGFVGSSVAFGFSPQTGCDTDVKIYDKQESKSTHSLEEVLSSEFIFLSVPTPANEDGSINTDIVNKALSDISKASSTSNIILLRSTVVPGTTRSFQQKYTNLNLLFNPEFLTERSANFDFINQSRFIIGSGEHSTSKMFSENLAELFRKRFGESTSIIQTNYETAELIKYMTNSFFATKISFLNEMKLVADKCGVDWDTAMDGFVRDGRIGHSHLNVPGHDGKFGFGGSCFPKDIQAIIKFGKSLGLDMDTLSGVWETNIKVRPREDWKSLKGRAVVDE